jgi:hypothetical protein
MSKIENFEYNGYVLVIEDCDYFYFGKCEELDFEDTSSDDDYLKKDFKKLVNETLKLKNRQTKNQVSTEDKDKKILELQKEIAYLNQKLESIKRIVGEV